MEMTGESRCAVCGWPLREKLEDGCVRGSCSQRPLPANLFDAERADAEYAASAEAGAVVIDDLLNTGAGWMMSQAEKAACFFLIDRMTEKGVAVEVGSMWGGATRLLDANFAKTYSLDIDHSRLRQEDFTNTEFVTGDSSETLPALLDWAGQPLRRPINLVLIDGDHSYHAVLRDINAVLRYRPQGQLLLLIHDSWMEPVRLAIDHAAWQECPYVHEVQKDLCVGDLGPNGFVGGLALAVLTPEERAGELVIGQQHDFMYRSCLEALRR